MVIRKTSKKGIHIIKIEGQKLPLETHKNVAGVAGLALLEDYPCDHGFEIEIHKGIKAGSGIGSSAASSAGAVFGINELMGKPLSRNELIKYAMKGEELASGSAHADNVSPVLLGGFTLVRCSKTPDVVSLPSPSELHATIIHPKIELKTSDARAVLKKKILLEKAVEQWGNLAALVSGLCTNDFDLIERSLVDVVIEPHRSALIPGFQELKKAAIDSGALGCGISGSGPSVFALSKGSETALRVQEEMNSTFKKFNIEYELHLSKINSKGIQIISSK
jgi:homoserine kinase